MAEVRVGLVESGIALIVYKIDIVQGRYHLRGEEEKLPVRRNSGLGRKCKHRGTDSHYYGKNHMNRMRSLAGARKEEWASSRNDEMDSDIGACD